MEKFPIFVKDRLGHTIYLTDERWDHALDHPGMYDDILDYILQTIRQGTRKQDKFSSAKFKYSHAFTDLPPFYTHVVVVVKFGWRGSPSAENNFVLTAYLVEKW